MNARFNSVFYALFTLFIYALLNLLEMPDSKAVSPKLNQPCAEI